MKKLVLISFLFLISFSAANAEYSQLSFNCKIISIINGKMNILIKNRSPMDIIVGSIAINFTPFEELNTINNEDARLLTEYMDINRSINANGELSINNSVRKENNVFGRMCRFDFKYTAASVKRNTDDNIIIY